MECLRIFSKVVLYLTMFGFFLKFYFIGQFMQFLEGHTTFVTIVESKVDSPLAGPTIFLCHDYGVSSAYEKYGVTSATVYDYIGYEKIPDISGKNKWDIYQEFKFLADLDLEFYFRINQTHQQRIRLGNTTLGDINIELSQVVTQFGHCIKISTNGTYNQQLTGMHIGMRMNTFLEGGSIKIKLSWHCTLGFP